jgi:two-component system, cell cycle sensor histidine kinase and response regulator CckA
VERRALVQAVGVLCAALAGSAILGRYLDSLDVEARRQTAAELARGSAFAIEQEFSRSLAAVSALAAMVEVGASDRELERVANRLLELNGGAAALQLARDGVVSHLWPLQGNEAARGLDLMKSPIHAPFVRAAAERGRPVLYGPFELVQGGAGLALRIPVTVEEAGKPRFWGVSSAIFRLDRLLFQSRLPRLAEAGFDYELWRQDAEGGRVLLASTSPSGAPLADPVGVEVALPGQHWSLGVEARGGWTGAQSRWVMRAAGVLVAILAAVLAYRVSALPAVLRREVAARTAELEVAHRKRLRAEEAQRQSQKLEAIGLLAGGVAHDFNNLLVGILGHADLLASEAAPGSALEESAQTIAQAAQRAAELTRQLLAFARLGQHRQVEVDVHAVVEEVAALLRRTLDKAIRIELALAAPLHHLRGDPGQIQQVVLNLAVNARDAMPEGGTLKVETALEVLEAETTTPGLGPGRYLVLAVADTGSGIAPEHLDRIFEPFFTTKEEGRGSGLGLATVYGIVKAHGGTVLIRSQLGRGTRFLVYLPVVEPSGVKAADATPVKGPRGAGVVMVVDDEDFVRRTAGRMLSSLGYEPVLLSGGLVALDWLAAQSSPPAAVLLDLAMPGMDGRSCFRQLRTTHPHLPVVISSGFASDGRVQELLDEGAAAFVAKPYRTADLARALLEALGPAAGLAGRTGDPA